jgi:hypothetical protein
MATQSTTKLRHLRDEILPFRISIRPGKPKRGNKSANSVPPVEGAGCVRRAEVAPVLTATLTVAAELPLRVTEVEDKEHVESAGAPAQLSETA